VGWIGPAIAGEIQGSECWVIPPKGSRGYTRPPNRFYLLPTEAYVVWLEPGRDDSWWFSSAYVAGGADIRRYCQDGRKLWPYRR